MSVGANTLLMSTIQNSTAENETVKQFLMGAGFNWRTRAGIDTNTANGDFMAAIGLARGIAGAAVMPVWEGAMLTRDPYTGAKSGQIQLTLQMLWNWSLVRASNFKRIKAVT